MNTDNSLYSIFVQSHFFLRYFVMIMLLAVIVKSLAGWFGNKSYTNLDNKLSLYLLIFTHLQLVAGLILYFISPYVKFDGATMSDKTLRYWTVEHGFAMLIAIALITFARISSKKMADDRSKFKRLAVVNIMALVIIIGTLAMSGRGII